MNILIVDDNQDARYLLQSLLSGHGHRVASAENGREALALLQTQPIDLVVSDILMPVMDGFQLCREVRKDENLRKTLFVFYTATYTQDSDADFAMKLGADDFIRKPAEPAAFVERIEAITKRAESATARSPEVDSEAEVLRLYSQRLVAKLEKRSRDLEAELARRKEAEASLRHYTRRLEVLREIDVAILEARSPESVAEIVLDALHGFLDPIRASVAVFDLKREEATVLAVRTEVPSLMTPGALLSIADIGSVSEMQRGVIRITNDLMQLERQTEFDRRLIEAGVSSCMVVPLRARGELIGSLNLGFASSDRTTEERTQAVTELANQLAIALRQTQLRQAVETHARELERHVKELRLAKAEVEGSYELISRTLSQTVEALAAAAEVRDPYTAGHQRRVTELAVAIARKLELDAIRVEGLRVAGLMHDIGKMAIPSELLSKPSKLSDLEYRMIQDHPQTARGILSTVEFPWPIGDIVLQHHERLDGSGYPSALSGDEILLEARILAVADVVEAMASHRPYRPARGIDQALREIRDGAGTKYDERVVEACTLLFESGEFALPE